MKDTTELTVEEEKIIIGIITLYIVLLLEALNHGILQIQITKTISFYTNTKINTNTNTASCI